jgi:hypothetical protein
MEAPVEQNPFKFVQLGEAGRQEDAPNPHLQPLTGRCRGIGMELLPDVFTKGCGDFLPACAIPEHLLTFMLGHAKEPALDRRPSRIDVINHLFR